MSRYTTRPWGWMVLLFSGKRVWVKIIHVKRGQRTSLQFHEYRTEWHVSIRGIRKVETKQLHRMEQGTYLEIAYGRPHEDDITRIQDDYGRGSDQASTTAIRADDGRI